MCCYAGCERWCRDGVGPRDTAGDVETLQTQPLVTKLYHPSLPEMGHEIAARQQKGFGAMLVLNWMAISRHCGFPGRAVVVYAGGVSGGVESDPHAAPMHMQAWHQKARAAAGVSETLLRISTVLKMAKVPLPAWRVAPGCKQGVKMG
ncbi:PLP-dependent transferase [Shigella flexneri]